MRAVAARCGDAAGTRQKCPPRPASTPPPPPPSPFATANLWQVHELQKELSEVSSNALLGLIQATEVLVTNAGFAADTAA